MKQSAIALSVLFSFAIGNCSLANTVDFAKQIEPIFAEHCYKCHGEKKGLGKLRLHSAGAIEESIAKHADLLGDGSPEKSELFERLVLPANHKRRMPKGGNPLPKEQIELIRQWIVEGAVVAVVASPEVAETEHAAEPKALPEVAPAAEAVVEKLTNSGAQVALLFSKSNLLTVSFALGSSAAGDDQLALLPSAAEQIYALNLTGAEASQEAWANLAKLNNLDKLHLEKSSITDSGLASLSGLQRLEYLNLYGTNITDAGLKHLEKLKHLKNLYLWQTKVSFDAARNLEKKIPGLEVNLGHDHPEVVRRRLTKELEATKSEFSQAESTLKSATTAKEKAEKRLKEIEEQLKALDGEPEAKKEEPK